MSRFRKKPAEIEARRYEKSTQIEEFRGWTGTVQCEDPDGDGYTAERCRIGSQIVNGDYQMMIWTLEEELAADPGDWIIKGVAGEFYPCKPDIFAQTYEPAQPPGGASA